MATLTIRNLDEQIQDFLRAQAAKHGRSMEAEVRHILSEAKSRSEINPLDIAKNIQAHFALIGGVEIEQPERPAALEPLAL